MFALLLVASACSSEREVGPSAEPPSATQAPTTTPTVTSEPAPAPTPSPTATATPTSAPSPTPTAKKDREDRGDGPNDDGGSGDSSQNQQKADILRAGDEGQAVGKLQSRLAELRYWLGPTDGVYGLLTEQAVLAFQGAEGLQRDGIFGPNTRKALKNASTPTPRDGSENHIEIDEARGILMVVSDGSTRWVFHTSTGTEEPYEHPSGETYLADTPNGEWSFTWQVDGWRDGRLGRMWRPKYFHDDGIAIHGFPEVPAYPASHGCARVTIDAMNFIWDQGLAPMGSRVLVYGRG